MQYMPTADKAAITASSAVLLGRPTRADGAMVDGYGRLGSGERMACCQNMYRETGGFRVHLASLDAGPAYSRGQRPDGPSVVLSRLDSIS